MNELKELCWVCLFSMICGPAILYGIGYVFAKVTYMFSHRRNQKVREIKSRRYSEEVVFDIDSKNKTLQEVQAERLQMRKILGGI